MATVWIVVNVNQPESINGMVNALSETRVSHGCDYEVVIMIEIWAVLRNHNTDKSLVSLLKKAPSAFMQQMVQSTCTGSYDNVIAES
jgi:hypothetical protein